MNSFLKKINITNKSVSYGHSELRSITNWHLPAETLVPPQLSNNMTITVTSHLRSSLSKSSTQSSTEDTTKQGRNKLYLTSCSTILWKNTIKLLNLWELHSATHIDTSHLDLISITTNMSDGCLKTPRKIGLLESKGGRGMFWKMPIKLSFIRIRECFIPKHKIGGHPNSIIKSLTHSHSWYYKKKTLHVGFTLSLAKTSHT